MGSTVWSKDNVLTRGAAGSLISSLLQVLGAEMPPVDGSAYTDYDGSQNGILACIEYGVMSPVAAEEGQFLAADAEILRGELAQTVVNFSALLQ